MVRIPVFLRRGFLMYGAATDALSVGQLDNLQLSTSQDREVFY